jgi:hypothetical protein
MAKLKYLGKTVTNQIYFHEILKEETEFEKCLPLNSADSFDFPSPIEKREDLNVGLQ